jgi:cell division protein FtsB
MPRFPRALLRVLARRTGWVAAIVVVLGYAISGPQGLGTLLEKHREIRELEEHNAVMKRQNESLKQEIQRLDKSPSEQELEIRKLKLLRPGETEFLLSDPAKDSEADPDKAR